MAHSKDDVCDLLIVGSGPAGMSAAINGASEGLKVCMLDANSAPGGQARESNAIENYPGFPEGVTGNELMNRFTDQAKKFDARMYLPVRAAALRKEDDGTLVVTSDDYTEFRSKTVLLSLGLSYRRLDADGLGPLMGRGVFYGLPGAVRQSTRKKCQYVVVGGANSAGQAVLHLAKNPNCNVVMLIRRNITDQMSAYLIDRIRQLPNVEVREGLEVAQCGANREGVLHDVLLSNGETICAENMFIFIGASPKTLWLDGTLELDERKFIRTWADVKSLDNRDLSPYETSMTGVFAAGDVRSGSVKRVASAIGEGGGALQMVHNYLSRSLK